MPFGQIAHLGIGKETTWGIPVAASDYLQLISEGLNKDIEQVISQAKKGIVDEPASFEGLNSIAGDVSAEVHPGSIGHLLRSALGAPVTTQPDGVGNPTVYQHVFTPVQDNFAPECALPPYTLEVHRDLAQAFQYAGAVVNDLNFSFGTDTKIMQGSASVIAKALALIAKTTPSFENTEPFRWHQATITINAGQNNDVQTLNFGVNNALEGKPTLNGSKEISRIKRNGVRTFPIGLTFDVTDLTEFNRYDGQNEVAAKIELVGALISGTYNYKLTIDIPKFKYTAFPINVGGADQLTVAATGVAKYDSASSHAMKVTLINTTTAY